MRQPRKKTPGIPGTSDAVGARQWGVVARSQLIRRGVPSSSIDDAVHGRLHSLSPGVYSTVPPPLLTAEAWHAAAILAGGDRACLCGHSGAWWAKLTKRQPPLIHVAVTGPREPVPGVRFHRLSLWDLKGLLAELEYHYDIGPEQVTTRRGSELERAFIRFLSARHFQLPFVNHPAGASTIDAVFADQRLVVELDGVKGHKGERRILRDHRRDLHRRADGFVVVRYHFAQLTTDATLIEAELDRHGVPRR